MRFPRRSDVPNWDPLQGFEQAPDSTKMAMIALAVRSIARSMQEMTETQSTQIEDLKNTLKWTQRTLVSILVTVAVGMIMLYLERGGGTP
jgi:hypothetical protein